MHALLARVGCVKKKLVMSRQRFDLLLWLGHNFLVA